VSWQATAWAVKQKTGSSGCKLLLLTLANYADDTGCCWPGQDALKNDTEQSLDTIQRQLKRLEGLGLIRKIIRPMGPGRWSSRTYFLNLTVAEMSKPQSAAQPGAEDGSPNGSPTMPQDARDHAAPDPVTMPHQTRDYAAPVRHEPSLDPESEPSLETWSEIPVTFTPPKKLKLSAAERQRAFKEGRKGIEVIQNQIARKLGFDGWEILGALAPHELDRITALEERGRLAGAELELLRLRKFAGEAVASDSNVAVTPDARP
jgi:Helix-turn-helix domain